jgi:hypothetical protein
MRIRRRLPSVSTVNTMRHWAVHPLNIKGSIFSSKQHVHCTQIDIANMPQYANKYDSRHMHDVCGQNGMMKTCVLKSACATVHPVRKLYKKIHKTCRFLVDITRVTSNVKGFKIKLQNLFPPPPPKSHTELTEGSRLHLSLYYAVGAAHCTFFRS